MESNWLETYYEALEFFYFEPQHMNPKWYPESKFAGVAKHLRKMEVTLNHNIRQFLLLAPSALRNNLFKEVFDQDFDGEFVLHGRKIDTEFKLSNCTQPDFLFVSNAEVISIEMKIAAKCNVDQILKYALLGLAVEIAQGRPKTHYLVILGSGALVGQFKERFESIDELINAIANTEETSFLHEKPARFREHQERFKQIVKQMRVEFLNYEHFAQFIRSAAPPQTDQSPGAEVYRNLISGLIQELKLRQLF